MKLLLKIKPWLERPRALWALAGVCLLITGHSLWGGFATDDHNFKMIFQGAPGIPELDQSPFDTFRFYFEAGPELRRR